jgi:hypothetical protein
MPTVLNSELNLVTENDDVLDVKFSESERKFKGTKYPVTLRKRSSDASV